MVPQLRYSGTMISFTCSSYSIINQQVYFLEVPDLDLLVCVVWSINRKESSYYRISFIFLTKDGGIVDESNN